MKRKALGKGLKAFLPEDYSILKEERYTELEIDRLRPNPLQPRKKFDPDAINELAQSIRASGILQPIVVTQEDGDFKIIVGERRWRAAQKIGLKKIPVLIRKMTKEEQLEASLIENLQREDLNPIEIATAYQKMVQELECSQQDVAEKVSKDRASVANYIRLLKLPREIQELLAERKLSMGHARALITLEDSELQISLARQVVEKDLSVRVVESAIKRLKRKPKDKAARSMDPNLLALQEEFIKALGTKVFISGTEKKGIVRIHYFSLEELNRIFRTVKGDDK
jgi:ParB family chromosome partitioning protein